MRFVIFLVATLLVSCGREREQSAAKPPVSIPKISKVVFFLENSESMFGYVNGHSQYVDVVAELSQMPRFVSEGIPTEYYLVNGRDPLSVNLLGDNPGVLKNSLNPTAYKKGDYTKSDLNAMFQIALEKVQNDVVCILISDGIFDIGQKESPENALAIEGKETRSEFIKRLDSGDLQTLIVKAKSDFDGKYFYTSKSLTVNVNQTRPFYVWVFGKTELLNRYFPEDYLSQQLKGFEDYARFIVLDESKIPYQIDPSKNRKGSFKLDARNNRRLKDAEMRQGEFQFAFAVDFTSLPYPDSYLTSLANYECLNSQFKVVGISRITKPSPGIPKTHTHLITVSTTKNPVGELQIVLRYELPGWIADTDTNVESHSDTEHTYGFKFLTDAISGAYAHKSGGKNLAVFSIEITN
jgi:hypothetical protein